MIRYPENTPLSKEAFEASGWQTVLDEARREDYSSMWQALSSAAREAVEDSKHSEGRVLWLLADACSMMLRPASLNEPFVPFMVMEDRRTALPEDLSSEEIEFLSSVYSDIDDPKLCARLADLVWLVRKPKDPNFATSAIDAYREVPISCDSWIRDGRECWDRAIQLCLMLRAGAGDRLKEIEQTLQSALLDATIDDGNLALWIADLLGKHGLVKEERHGISTQLEVLAKAYDEAGNIHRARDYYECTGEWYHRVGNRDKFSEMAALCAETWVKEAVFESGLFHSKNALEGI